MNAVIEGESRKFERQYRVLRPMPMCKIVPPHGTPIITRDESRRLAAMGFAHEYE